MNKYLSCIVKNYSYKREKKSKCSISIRDKKIICIKEKRKKGKGRIKKQDLRRDCASKRIASISSNTWCHSRKVSTKALSR